jgi:hypothetical protein
VLVTFGWPKYGGVGPLMPYGSKMSRREYREWRDAHTFDPARDGELAVQSDLAPAAWIQPLLAEDTDEVRAVVPQGFEAYARVFFPFVSDDIVVDGEPDQELITWTEMAGRHGRIAHALMEAEPILAGPAGKDENQTCIGSLSGEQFAALLPILSRHTSAAGSWFLLWDGFGNLNERAFRRAPKVSYPLRDFYLLHGPHNAYADFPDEPNYWWPRDRAWCVCTDTDFDWAYLSGSAGCIDDVLSVPVLDAYATRPEHPAQSGMDVINDPDGTVPREI